MNAGSPSWEECFTAPVSAAAPVGDDPAYDPEFLRLSKEMEQSRSIQGQVTNWTLVQAESARLLRDRAKDLRAASWLVVATAHLSGWAGVAAGLAGYAAFVERFWPTAHPQRARARTSFVAWLWDGLARALAERAVAAADRAYLHEVEALVTQLDAALAARLGDANPGAIPFRRVVRDRIASLPEDAPTPPTPEEPSAPPSIPPTPPTEEAEAEPSCDEQSDTSEDEVRAEQPVSGVAQGEPPADSLEPTLATEGASPGEDGETALEHLVSRARALPSRRERFLATLNVATVARKRAETDVALALCEHLLPEVDATLEAWEPGVCLDLFAAYVETLDAVEVDRERATLRSHLFRRLLALDPAQAFRLRASRNGE
ncbi:MAG: TssA family type VI secretion system protein [Polyangiaceae bacterium]